MHGPTNVKFNLQFPRLTLESPLRHTA